MLGKLARWLRMLGFKTMYTSNIPDNELYNLQELVITRDVNLFLKRLRAGLKTLLIRTDNIEEQIAVAIKITHNMPKVDEVPIVRYCTVCGGEIIQLPREEVVKLCETVPDVEKVPEGVLKRHNTFWYCPRCRKFYWAGSHHVKNKQMYSRAYNIALHRLDIVMASLFSTPCYILVLSI